MSEIKFKSIKRAVNICSFFCLVFLFVVQVSAAWQTVGNVTRVTQTTKKNGVILDTSSRAKVSVEFFDINAVRVRVAPKRQIRARIFVCVRLFARP